MNSAYLLIGVQVMYRRLLVAEKLHRYVNDIAKPLLAVLVVTGIARALMEDKLGSMAKIVRLVFALGIATSAVLISDETLRKRFSL